MVDTAKAHPAVFFATCARLIPGDVKVTVQQALPGGLDDADWAALFGVVAAVKQSMPEARGMKAEAVAEHVSRALAGSPSASEYDAKMIFRSGLSPMVGRCIEACRRKTRTRTKADEA
jgi:hypothetical protein